MSSRATDLVQAHILLLLQSPTQSALFDAPGRLASQVGWPGLRVCSRIDLTYIHQMNRVNSRNDLCQDDSTINIVPGIIIITIIKKYMN